MTAFIRQEALEKAREIQLKADEEFAIEKSKLVRQETAAIDTLYEKKFKQASMSQQITRSTLANRTRLRVLSSRQELLDNLFQQARDSISGIATKDAKKYQVVLKGLVLEGLYALNESKVTIRARTKDNDAVKEAIGEAEKEFNEVVGKEVSAELDEDEPLPEGSYVSSISSPSPRFSFWTVWFLTCVVPAVWLFSAVRAKSRSTTRSKSGCGCSKSAPFRPSGRRCLGRTRTEGSTTRCMPVIQIPVLGFPICSY